MKPLTLLAAASIAVGLTACTQSSGGSTAQQTTRTPTPQASQTAISRSAGISCPQRYHAWQNGPAKKTIAALNTVNSAVVIDDIGAQITALKKAGPEVDKAGSYPIPVCADPKGYWGALLLHVNAAAKSAKTATGTSSLGAALKAVPQLERQLKAELKHTAAVKEL